MSTILSTTLVILLIGAIGIHLPWWQDVIVASLIVLVAGIKFTLFPEPIEPSGPGCD